MTKKKAYPSQRNYTQIRVRKDDKVAFNAVTKKLGFPSMIQLFRKVADDLIHGRYAPKNKN